MACPVYTKPVKAPCKLCIYLYHDNIDYDFGVPNISSFAVSPSAKKKNLFINPGPSINSFLQEYREVKMKYFENQKLDFNSCSL